MGPSQSSQSVTPLVRKPSHSSIVSVAESFHSSSTTPRPSDDEKHLLHRSGSGNGNGANMHIGGDGSGFEKQPTTHTFTPRPHRQPRLDSTQAPVSSTSHQPTAPSRPQTSPSMTPVPVPSLPQPQPSRTSASRHTSRHSSRRSSFSPSPPTARPRTMTRSNTSASDPYLAHQRAISIFQSLDANTHPLGAPTSPKGQVASHLRSTSTLRLASHPDGAEAEQTLSVHHMPTTIDWTDPEARRRTYDRHDRQKRGLGGLWRRSMSRLGRLCGGSGSGRGVEFWDESKDDGGSVRRYRLDLEEGGENCGEALENEPGSGRQGGGCLRSTITWKSASCFRKGDRKRNGEDGDTGRLRGREIEKRETGK